MPRLVPDCCLIVGLLTGCDPQLTDEAAGSDAAEVPSGAEWVHDPSRLIAEGGAWVLYGSGTGGEALSRSVVDLETGRVTPTTGLDADTLTGGWWRDVQEWNATGEFDAPTVSDDGQFIAFTVYDEDDDEIRDVTGLAVRTSGGFAAAGVILASEDEETETPRAMDASFVSTADATFLVFGSHAGGIFIAELDPTTGLLLDDGGTPETSVASERFTSIAQDLEDGIEAPYIHAHNGNFYLFVNKGRCCQGVDSTYTVVVGRATDVTGPYVDQDGVDLRDGGGTTFLATSGRFIGPGHVGIRDTSDGEAVSFHFYDGDDSGVSKLAVHNLSWSDGWPVAGALRATHQQ